MEAARVARLIAIIGCLFAAPVAAGAEPAMTTTGPDAALVADLVAANHILYDEAVVDGFGHVSARSAANPQHFLLARSMAPGLVTAADIMEFDRDGEAIDAHGRAVYLERFIHAAIYKARPDVKAIVHSHSPAVIPFGVTGVKLRPIYHMSAFLGPDVPVFEIRDAGGDATDMLIRTPALGDALAETLGQSSVLLMRGHGDVAVADTVKLAVFRAVYTEINARLEGDALRLGNGHVIFLNDDEAAAAAKVNSGLVDRAWDLWKRKAEATK